MTQLVRNPTNIGDIYFSGSQTVKKGQEVTWILDDTWAFKATEDCAVSTNASPFVNLKTGSTFLIYKRTQDDIDAGNQKGIYIFDRDTVVALAYPQDVTQDIIIENDIYNNNYNAITIEADQMPTAKITKSVQEPIVNQWVTLSATSSIAVPPATLVAYEWRIDNVVKSTAPSFGFLPTAITTYGVTLTVTDSDGRKNVVSDSLKAKPKPVYDDIVYDFTSEISRKEENQEHAEFPFLEIIRVPKSGTGTIQIKISTGFKNESSLRKSGMLVRVYINGVPRKEFNFTQDKGIQSSHTFIYTYTGTLNSSDDVYATITMTGFGGAFSYGEYGGASTQANIKITNRTA